MSVELRIGRLVLDGLPPGPPAAALRTDIARALGDMLTGGDVARLAASLPRHLATIEVAPPPPGRPLARHLAAAIAAALRPDTEPAR